MCGIGAIWRARGGDVHPDELGDMLAAIAHRGPDDAGYSLLDAGRLGLAHVRLSVIDLHTGDQPIFDRERGTAIVFNGEVYDHEALREDLAARGHRFYTTTDTEVVLHLYGEYGLDFVDHLNGEFSLLIWDAPRRRLVAVRDPVGIKPLFYRHTRDELLFGSEVKALLALPQVPRRLDPEYLTGPFTGACPATACAFEGIRVLPPGHLMIAEGDGRVELRRYFEPPLAEPALDISFDEAKREVRARLWRAVERRLTADVPVDVYLSAGLDSTLVLALMRELGARPTAYHISFPRSEFDESDDAARIAAHYDVELDRVDCSMDSLAGAVLDTVRHIEAPVPNLNSAAKLLLSRHVRSRGTKVCLTGEGADESFAGYAYFKLEQLWAMIEAGGDRARRGHELLEEFKRRERRSEGIHWDGRDRWKRAARPYGYASHLQMRIDELGPMARAMFPTGKLGLGATQMPPVMLRRYFPPAQLAGMAPLDVARHMAFHALSGYIIPSLGDRVEMASSLECRTPFLDREVVDFACRLPPEHLVAIEQLREKHVVREAFADILPPLVRDGTKHPLLAPSWRLLARTRTGKDLVATYLAPRAVAAAGIFRPAFVAAMRALWKLAPAHSGLGKRVDLAMGAILTTHVFHDQLIAGHMPRPAPVAMIRRDAPAQLAA